LSKAIVTAHMNFARGRNVELRQRYILSLKHRVKG